MVRGYGEVAEPALVSVAEVECVPGRRRMAEFRSAWVYALARVAHGDERDPQLSEVDPPEGVT